MPNHRDEERQEQLNVELANTDATIARSLTLALDLMKNLTKCQVFDFMDI